MAVVTGVGEVVEVGEPVGFEGLDVMRVAPLDARGAAEEGAGVVPEAQGFVLLGLGEPAGPPPVQRDRLAAQHDRDDAGLAGHLAGHRRGHR